MNFLYFINEQRKTSWTESTAMGHITINYVFCVHHDFFLFIMINILLYTCAKQKHSLPARSPAIGRALPMQSTRQPQQSNYKMQDSLLIAEADSVPEFVSSLRDRLGQSPIFTCDAPCPAWQCMRAAQWANWLTCQKYWSRATLLQSATLGQYIQQKT